MNRNNEKKSFEKNRIDKGNQATSLSGSDKHNSMMFKENCGNKTG